MHPRLPICAACVALLVSSAASAQETDPEEIVVTSSALRETALELAQPASVLSGDELRRQAASSIGETIAREPGVSATYFGPAASRPVIRGLGGERVLMLQDGVSALDVSSLSQDHAVAVESVLADQIEILKGPATLLFGSGAVGGVVNVVDGRIPTQFAQRANRAVVEIRGDTAAEERTGVGRLELGTDALRMHVDAFRRDTEDLEIPGYAFSPRERSEHLAEEPDEQLARGRLANSASEHRGGAFGISAGNDLGFAGVAWGRYEARYGIPGGHHEHDKETQEDADEQHDHAGGVRIDMRQDRYDVKAERVLEAGAFERLRIRGSYTDYEHREIEGTELGTLFEQDAFDVRMSLDHGAIADWRGTVGAQHVEIDFAARGAEAFVPASATAQTALFVFEQRDFDSFSLELGARVENQRIDPDSRTDHRRYDEIAYSFSAGAVWSFATDYTVAVNATRSQRHPQSAELYANGPHLAVARFEIGDPTLERETARTIDVTLHRHANAGVHWSLASFYNDFSGFIFAADAGFEVDGLPVFRYAQADAALYGFEGEITFPLLRQGGRTFEMRLASDYVRGRLDRGGNLPQMPPLRYGVELHYESGPLHLGLAGYRYAKQDRTAPNERSTDTYTMLDADASYRWSLGERTLLLFVRATNLLDEDARRHTSPLKEIAPLPGRSFQAGLRAEF